MDNITKIRVKNMFGISEIELDGSSIELTGKKGAGKSSLLDAIRYGLTNRSDRAYVVRQGADEGEIIIEAGGLRIDRKRKASMDTSQLGLRENGLNVPRPQSFLNDIFTELQLNPVEFLHKSTDEQNRIILSLITYSWDMSTIEGWFGEIPKGIDYKRDILSVLDQIQADNGVYYQTRQQHNSEKLFKRKAAEEIGLSIPDNFNAAKWEAYDTGAKYSELTKIQSENEKIRRAKALKDGYDSRLRGLEADRDIAISSAKEKIAGERSGLEKTIERLRAEIKAAEDKIAGLDGKLEQEIQVAQSDFKAVKAMLDAEVGQIGELAEKQPTDTTALQEEISMAEAMKKHLNEHARMVRMQQEVAELQEKADVLTEKIELARKLPGQILKEANLPIEGLSVKNGVPLVNGLPLSNLSDGEKLMLCVDVAVSNPKGLQIILIDGTERLDDESRAALYQRCRDKGLQFIASRTTNDDELQVVEL